jgi:caffeoyl-CoA O-methyltransferase
MKGTPITPKLYDYIVSTFSPEDAVLETLPAAAEARGIPLIHISPEQGKFLQLLLKMTHATRALEIGSLFGYSAIWIARGLPEGGKLVTIELAPLHAQATRENAALAGLAHKIDVREGDARAVLPTLTGENLFDLIFVDADKAQYVNYLEPALALLRSGGVLVVDNASAGGDVWQETPARDAARIHAIRDMNRRIATHPQLTSLLVPISDGMVVAVKNG